MNVKSGSGYWSPGVKFDNPNLKVENKILMNRTYSAESLVDMEGDVWDCVEGVPKDDHGFQLGTFRVTVEWVDNES